MARIFARVRVGREADAHDAVAMPRAAHVGLRFPDTLWPVAPLDGRQARVVCPLPRLQLVNRVADEVANDRVGAGYLAADRWRPVRMT